MRKWAIRKPAVRKRGAFPAVSVRMLSEVLNRLTSGQLEADHGALRQAAARLAEVEDLLRRGVSCGAFADPWNMLGFQALFPLSAAREDSVRDQRLDELVQVVEQIFNLYSRLSSEAAAGGDETLAGSLAEGMDRLAAWWDPFATVEVSEVRRVHGGEAATSARRVAAALPGWRQRGEAAADLAFWRGQIDAFPILQVVLSGRGRSASQRRLPRVVGPARQLAGTRRAGAAGRGRLFLPRPGAALDAGAYAAGRSGGRDLAAHGRTPRSGRQVLRLLGSECGRILGSARPGRRRRRGGRRGRRRPLRGGL